MTLKKKCLTKLDNVKMLLYNRVGIYRKYFFHIQIRNNNQRNK